MKVGKQLGNVFPFLWGGFGVLKGCVVWVFLGYVFFLFCVSEF